MCRLLAKIAPIPAPVDYELLTAPHSLRRQSECGKQLSGPSSCGPHASGCGAAWIEGSSLKLEKRGADDRWNPTFTMVLESLATPALIAHNRLASPGLRVDVSCSHPYMLPTKDTAAAFCHNGSVKTLMDEAKKRGVSDSQIFFEHLIEEAPDLSHESVVRLVKECANTWEYSSLTSMLLTPSTLHVWRCYDPRTKDTESFERYYTIYMREKEGAITLASEPVDPSTDWKLLKNGSLVSITRGDVLAQKRSQLF